MTAGPIATLLEAGAGLNILGLHPANMQSLWTAR